MVSLIGLVASIGILSQRETKKVGYSNLTLADIEAFANTESNSETSGEGGSTTPPDAWNFVPDRFIKAKPKTEKVVCKSSGSLAYSEGTLTGEYAQDVTYIISMEIKNCDGKAKGAWCDQRQVGVKILNIERA